MAKILKEEEIKKAIVDYVTDERKSQAVLLDGEWGSGKTFFVKKQLIPDLEKLKNTNIFTVSLYGVSSVDMIQDMIYEQWIKLYVESATDRMGSMGQVINKGIGFCGKPFIRFVESKLGAEGAVDDFIAKTFDANVKNVYRNIIIFDDFERCRINIIQLMGYLNNLSENFGFRLVLVANEKEIDCLESTTDEALKYLVAIKTIEKNNQDAESDNQNQKKDCCEKDIKATVPKIFGEDSLYERTREKLIGLTIPYSVSVSDAFEAVVKKYITDTSIQTRVIDNKEKIIDIINENDHKNLRTLIAACIVIESILTCVDEELFVDKDKLDKEIDTVILYSVYSAIRKSSGKPLFSWPYNVRYACVNAGLFKSAQTKIYGYAFVDEYWKTQCVDKDVIIHDLNGRIEYLNGEEQSRIQSQEHKNLALFKLRDWYLMRDDDVKTLIVQMKCELSEKKYNPNEFKDIICVLMGINDPDYGMSYIRDFIGDSFFESTDASQFIGMKYVEPKANRHKYEDWEKVNISEFIQLMVSYFDDREFTLTSEMIRVLAEDKQFAYNYRVLTMPLLEMIEKHNISIASKDNNGVPISDISWDASLVAVCRDKRNDFINQGKFLSLFDYTKLIENVSNASSGEIYNFCDALKKVYSFSDLNDIFASDLDIVNRILVYIEENYNEKINTEKSRTKEIAFVRLLGDLKRYRKALGYVEEAL